VTNDLSGAVRVAVLLAVLAATRASAQVGPTVTPGFPNVPQTAGAILSGLNAPQQGRTAIIAYHNGLLFTVPEVPASQPGADFQVRTWNITNPTQPIELATWGVTPMPINAHGYFKSGPYLILGSNWPPGGEWSFLATAPFTVQRTSFPELTCAGTRGCLFGPWYIGPSFWSYDAVGADAELYFDWQLQSTWDHLGTTGVIGHPFIIGDLLIFASDQSRTGVATYDIGDPTNPQLLDVLTTGGPGGYFPEVWGSGDGRLYIVFPYRTGGNGFRVVDATDPADLRFVTDRALPGAESMYIQFQDEFAFMGGHKVDMRTFESVLHLDGANVERPNQPGVVGIDTSQFLLPLGNLLVTGGVGPNEGMAIWAHQAEPDTRGPAVAYHIPQAGRVNYPRRAPISLLIHETLETATIVNGQTFIVRPLGGAPLGGRLTFAYDDLLTFQPDTPLQANTTYEVVIPAGGIKDAAGNGIEGYAFSFSTGASTAGNAPPEITDFDASPQPVAPGQTVTFSAAADDGDGDPLEYRFDFGDGSAKTAWSGTAQTSTTYDTQGHFRASVQVRDTTGAISSATLGITVLTPAAGPRPTNSSSIACDAGARRVWVVNPDNDTLAALDTDTLVSVLEVPVCDDPRAVAVAASGDLWVACHDDDRVVVVDSSGGLVATIPTGYGSAPAAIATAPNGSTAYVALGGAGRLLRFDTASRQQTGDLALGPGPRAIAVSGDGARVLVTRFLSPRDRAEIWDVNTATFTLTRTIGIAKFGDIEHFDSTAEGRGVANYLTAIAIAPLDDSVWVAANKPNSERGVLVADDLDQDNTVRNIVFQFDLASGALLRAIDIDNSDSSSAVAFSPRGDYMLVTLQGNNALVVFDTLVEGPSSGLGGFVTRLATGLAPQGVCADAATERIFVENFLSRSVTAFEGDTLFNEGVVNIPSTLISTVTEEVLSPQVLSGKRIFYNASDTRMSSEGYLSCATCHLDGGHDGRVWDFTGRGEGLRNTTTLQGRGGTAHGNVHWSANFDEIQDFENDIRGAFGGSGFLSDTDFAATQSSLGAPKAGLSAALDDLAAYVQSLGNETLPRSPFRNADGTMTDAAAAGEEHFLAAGCDGCHSGDSYTDSTLGSANLHDVGTVRTTSGGRLGGPLPGIDTPTLLGVWATPPYLHDGSAETLSEVFRSAGGTVIAAESGQPLNGAYLVNQWVEYNNDDTVRGRAYMAFGNGSARLRFSNVDGGSGGNANVEVRYSSGYGIFTLQVTANGTTRSAPLPLLGNNPAWRLTNWGRVRIENVPLNAGSTNTIELWTSNSSPYFSIDEILVSTADDLAAAQPHRQVLALPAAEQNEILAYLNELDGAPAGGPQASPTQPPATTPTPTATHTPTPTATAVPVFSIAGAVTYFGGGGAVSGAEVALTGAAPQSETTAGDGTYAFGDVAPGSWTLRPAKQGDTAAALSPLDAAWALQASVGNRTLSPLESLACDVTGNGTVSPFDAAQILQRIVDLMPRFPAAEACGSDWIFMPADGVAGGNPPLLQSGSCTPASIDIASLSAPMTGASFSAAVFGDCTLNGGAAAAALATAAPGAAVKLGHTRRRGSRRLRLPVYVEGASSLRALDVTLTFDPDELRFVGIRRGRSARNALTAGREIAPGRVRAVFASIEAQADEGAPLLFALFERRTRSGGSVGVGVAAAAINDQPVSATTRH